MSGWGKGKNGVQGLPESGTWWVWGRSLGIRDQSAGAARAGAGGRDSELRVGARQDPRDRRNRGPGEMWAGNEGTLEPGTGSWR